MKTNKRRVIIVGQGNIRKKAAGVPGILSWLRGLRIQCCHCWALVTAWVNIGSLAQELLHGTGLAKRGKKKKKKEEAKKKVRIYIDITNMYKLIKNVQNSFHKTETDSKILKPTYGYQR